METKPNQKSSRPYLFNSYVWLVNTIARGPISRAEIDEKWARSSVNEYKHDSIPESNFHRWRGIIKSLFGIDIKCNAYNEYYIDNAEDLRGGNLPMRMLNLMSINNLLKDCEELSDRILFEPVPSGEKFLTPIIEAMRDKTAVEMSYQSFKHDYPMTFIVEPYCIKMFKQRWYLLAYSLGKDEMRVYALDRIHSIEPTKRKYAIPADFDAERFFRDAYGVTVLDDQQQPEQIVISIDEDQAHYLRTLPLHPSQKEIEPINGYPAFNFYLYPADEFLRELYAYGSALEVHEPKWLREQFYENAKATMDYYKDAKQ